MSLDTLPAGAIALCGKHGIWVKRESGSWARGDHRKSSRELLADLPVTIIY